MDEFILPRISVRESISLILLQKCSEANFGRLRNSVHDGLTHHLKYVFYHGPTWVVGYLLFSPIGKQRGSFFVPTVPI